MVFALHRLSQDYDAMPDPHAPVLEPDAVIVVRLPLVTTEFHHAHHGRTIEADSVVSQNELVIFGIVWSHKLDVEAFRAYFQRIVYELCNGAKRPVRVGLRTDLRKERVPPSDSQPSSASASSP